MLRWLCVLSVAAFGVGLVCGASERTASEVRAERVQELLDTGKTLLKQDRHDEAVEHLEHVLLIEPAHIEAPRLLQKAVAAAEADSGRVEATLIIGGEPLSGERITIEPDHYFQDILPAGKQADTGEDGRCVFEDLPPGPYSVSWMKRAELMAAEGWTPMSTTSHRVGFTLAPGETKAVQIGGVGRPVIGRLVPPPDAEVEIGFQSSSFRRMYPHIERPAPPEGLAQDELQAWYEEYARSEEGLAQRQAGSSYFGDIEADGAFRFEDIPPGRYNIQFELGSAERLDGPSTGRAHALVEVPAPEDGDWTAEPHDVGEIEIQVLGQLPVGSMAPAFEVPDLDGGTLRLADFRGQYVLLDFWATWCGPCIAEKPNLHEVYEAFGDDPRFAMIALSLDNDEDTLKRYLEDEEAPWLHGYLGPWSDTDLPDEYGVRGIPQIMLIGPEGDVLARDLRGGNIATAIASHLGSPGALEQPRDLSGALPGTLEQPRGLSGALPGTPLADGTFVPHSSIIEQLEEIVRIQERVLDFQCQLAEAGRGRTFDEEIALEEARIALFREQGRNYHRIASLERIVEIRERQFEHWKSRADAGTASPPELAEAEVALAEARIALLRAQEEKDRARMRALFE